ncbi:MAG: hypothetical protein Q7R39_05890, partial [Dehalococcoidia bacterium]|nr:hypothetical protein [Dehalococcoidia bacterium]
MNGLSGSSPDADLASAMITWGYDPGSIGRDVVLLRNMSPVYWTGIAGLVAVSAALGAFAMHRSMSKPARGPMKYGISGLRKRRRRSR